MFYEICTLEREEKQTYKNKNFYCLHIQKNINIYFCNKILNEIIHISGTFVKNFWQFQKFSMNFVKCYIENVCLAWQWHSHVVIIPLQQEKRDPLINYAN